MMDAFTRAGFEAWGRSDAFKALVARTLTSMRWTFPHHERVNVSVSGGKDSLVMLDLALRAKPNLFVWHWDYGIYMPREIESEVLSILAGHFKLGDKLQVDKRASTDPGSTAGYRAFFKAINDHLREHAITLNLVGLRSEESCARKQRCKNGFESTRDMTTWFPIADRKWRDEWAYLVTRGIPDPSAYDKKAPLLGWDKARFVTFFDPEFEHLGGTVQDQFLFFKEHR